MPLRVRAAQTETRKGLDRPDMLVVEFVLLKYSASDMARVDMVVVSNGTTSATSARVSPPSRLMLQGSAFPPFEYYKGCALPPF